MARKKSEDSGSGGSPAWMATFSDLMNLLLCFFVLLFAMSSVDAEKFELVVASLHNSFSVLPAGGSSISEGQLISSGISQLDKMDVIYNEMLNAAGNTEQDIEGEEDFVQKYEMAALDESEEMAENIRETAKSLGIQDKIEVDFNGQYVTITLNGSLLFDSGSVEMKSGAVELVDKIGDLLEQYGSNVIEVEGHTDNVPVSEGSKYKNNDILSAMRALSVVNYLRANKNIDYTNLKFSGRGEYSPVADNSTEEGRARNRRVEIKIYNSFNSN